MSSPGKTTSAPPRAEDVFRHLEDLRTGTCEGNRDWADRVAYFEQEVQLLDPVVRRVLDETDSTFLDGTGEAAHHTEEDQDGGRVARWDLGWPAQREATSRHGGPVQPVQVLLVFGRGTTHPHLSGSMAGTWPCQVRSEADAARQEPIVRAIVEAELHQRIFEGRWGVVPAFTRQHGAPAHQHD